MKPPSSPLEAPFKDFKPPSSPLEAPLKMKPPSSPLKAPFNAEGLKPPSSPLEASFKPPWSPLQGEAPPLKPPWSPLEAPLKPPWSLPKVKPPSTFRPSSPPPSPPDPSSPLKGASEGGTSEPAPECLWCSGSCQLFISLGKIEGVLPICCTGRPVTGSCSWKLQHDEGYVINILSCNLTVEERASFTQLFLSIILLGSTPKRTVIPSAECGSSRNSLVSSDVVSQKGLLFLSSPIAMISHPNLSSIKSGGHKLFFSVIVAGMKFFLWPIGASCKPKSRTPSPRSTTLMSQKSSWTWCNSHVDAFLDGWSLLLKAFLRNLGSLGVVLSCDGVEGVLTWCFFVLFVFQKTTTACRVSLDSLVLLRTWVMSRVVLAEFSL